MITLDPVLYYVMTCAWCDRFVGHSTKPNDHGICHACAEAELRRERLRRADEEDRCLS